jgi:hypothetical protein
MCVVDPLIGFYQFFAVAEREKCNRKQHGRTEDKSGQYFLTQCHFHKCNFLFLKTQVATHERMWVKGRKISFGKIGKSFLHGIKTGLKLLIKYL